MTQEHAYFLFCRYYKIALQSTVAQLETGSGNMVEQEVERTQEMDDGEECCGMLFSGYGMNSQVQW